MSRYEETRRNLRQYLLDLPLAQRNNWTTDAHNELLRALFCVSTGGPDSNYLSLLFPRGLPDVSVPWNLKEAQGAVAGSEYTEAARGRPCGHIFENEEATYFCRTCTTDDTCVLCTRCFHASNHEGHQVSVSLSGGGGGCCDCGDPEAWKREVVCGIHTAGSGHTQSHGSPGTRDTAPLPQDFKDGIEGAVSAAMDYVIDVFSCSSESMRVPKSENIITAAEIIRKDESMSRLQTTTGQSTAPDPDPEFVLVLWNDEKHSVDEVQEQVARAAGKPRSFGLKVAYEVDKVGRSIVSKSSDVPALLQQAKILSQIKLTTTIRSSRDTFRERMCGTIIDWLNDIAGCSAGDEHQYLMDIVCKQLLQPWNMGSNAFNLRVAREGLEDRQAMDNRLDIRVQSRHRRMFQQRMQAWQRQAEQERREMEATAARNDRDDDEEDMEDADQDDAEDLEDEGEDAMDVDQDVILTIGEDGGDPNHVALQAVEALVNRQPEPSNPQSDESEEDHEPTLETETDRNLLFTEIPRLRGGDPQHSSFPAPSYWLKHDPQQYRDPAPSVEEDLSLRVRVDYLVFYDMRMWKTLRQSLRHLYISTLVTVPKFKRILSLRFAALYTHLSQLYLLADREAEHSIILMSLQMLTTPTIAEEIVVNGNFYTRLLAILYTFLTKRQVGEPEDVDPLATISFESGTLSNRRFYHLFHDIKYVLEVPKVKEYIRSREECLSQFIDFAKLFQGICPNKRAVGEHVEYESDAWLMASTLTRDVSRLSKQFCDCFAWRPGTGPTDMVRSVRAAAKAATVNSMGAEAYRFEDAEMEVPTRFKRLTGLGSIPSSNTCHEPIVDCEVETSSISIWHALHYILSWLIDAGKSMSSEQLRSLLKFSHRELLITDPRSAQKLEIEPRDSEDYMIAMFDVPVRVCAFLAQVRSGMWVRNGMAVRHQVEYYRSVMHRDLSHQRDIFLLQTAFVVCQPPRFLAQVMDRFTLTGWAQGNYKLKAGFDEQQMLDVAEEFLHLLIVILSDRTLLVSRDQDSNAHIAIAKRDIVHTLCFKPLTHSELSQRLPEKVTDMEEYEDIVSEVADYKAPEGLADAGTLKLKEEHLLTVDPYYAYYNKSQREEAENIVRARIARRNSASVEESFWEPQLQRITSGVFVRLSKFSQAALFAHIIGSFLHYTWQYESYHPGIQSTRVEALLQVLLHLILIASMEDDVITLKPVRSPDDSFVFTALTIKTSPASGDIAGLTILQQLFGLLRFDRFKASSPRIKFLLLKLRHANEPLFDEKCEDDDSGLLDLKVLSSVSTNPTIDASSKKKEAQARNAKVMAAFKAQQTEFMENQAIDWGDDVMSDSDDDFASVAEAPVRTYEVPGGTCILCQEDTNEHRMHGTLAFVSESRMFRETDLGDSGNVRDVQAMPLRLDQPLDQLRSHGMSGTGTPYSGGNEVEAKSLGKGFSPSHLDKGPVFTGCGHVMHWTCFQDYCSATSRRHFGQHARTHPEHYQKKEFVCPLCKALGNTFMPVSWRPQPARDAPLGPPSNFLNWVEDIDDNAHLSEPHLSTSAASFFNRTMVSREAPRHFRSNLLSLSNDMDIARISGVPATLPSQELMAAQDRIANTLKSNDMLDLYAMHRYNTQVPQKAQALEVLIDSIGNSISATEIAYRGTQSFGTWISNVSQQTITHLRTLNETIMAYGLVNSTIQDPKMASTMQAAAARHLRNMFIPGQDSDVTMLLSQDVFGYLAKSTFYLGSVSVEEFCQHMRLALLAEIVKVIMAAILTPKEVEKLAGGVDLGSTAPSSSQEREQFSVFVQHIITHYTDLQVRTAGLYGREILPPLDISEDPNMRVDFDALLRSMIYPYLLAFARRCLLLVHIRFGIDFASVEPSPNENELEALSSTLHLPTLESLIEDLSSVGPGKDKLYDLINAWLNGWTEHRAHVLRKNLPPDQLSKQRIGISIPHPTVYELVRLPHTHDTLNAIILDKQCPTAGGPIQDPYVCLLCGAIFCGQSKCCSVDGEGGCTRHVPTCGGNIGIFLNIRKCAILMMHNKRGSFFVAPYLDKHGEADMGGRRHAQLFLSGWRYDKLFREVWLGFNGGVASAVARRLESEINTGGWETL